MRDSGKHRIDLIRWGLAALLVADLALLIVHGAYRSSPRSGSDQKELARQRDLLKGDVERAKAIWAKLPTVQQDYDKFYAENLGQAAHGYSTIVADLGEIAQKAGLRADTHQFRQKQIEGRGMEEIEVATTVEGEYGSLVRFISGLEQSKNFYLVDGLTLASPSTGPLKLNVQLRTYLRY